MLKQAVQFTEMEIWQDQEAQVIGMEPVAAACMRVLTSTLLAIFEAWLPGSTCGFATQACSTNKKTQHECSLWCWAGEACQQSYEGSPRS